MTPTTTLRCSSVRSGKVLVLLTIMLPMLFGLVGLVLDGGLMMHQHRALQHSVDAAASGAAMELRAGGTGTEAIAMAHYIVATANEMSEAVIEVNVPPSSGVYAGQDDHIEVVAQIGFAPKFFGFLGLVQMPTLHARAVAGVRPVTAEAALVVLDSNPDHLLVRSPPDCAAAFNSQLTAENAVLQSGVASYLLGIPLVGAIAENIITPILTQKLLAHSTNVSDLIAGLPLSTTPAVLGGLEVLGLGELAVDGAVQVNTAWGGWDENGRPVGTHAGPPSAVFCTPILPATHLRARDIRVVGGVDNLNNYSAYASGDPFPLQANRLPVPNPLRDLPVPSSTSDPSNLDATIRSPGHLTRVALPTSESAEVIVDALAQIPLGLKALFSACIPQLEGLTSNIVVEPGVYESITAIAPAGGITFEPGIYVIRGRNPATQMSLCLIGPVQADGVLFYITDSSGFDATTGMPDAADDPDVEPEGTLEALYPSTLIASLIVGGKISGLDDPNSPFHQMLVYQRTHDIRPIVIEAQQLLGNSLSGTIYAKSGSLQFIGGLGEYDIKAVAASMRFITVFNTTIAPSVGFPAATDVLRLE